jgi:hypothetical protein
MESHKSLRTLLNVNSEWSHKFGPEGLVRKLKRSALRLQQVVACSSMLPLQIQLRRFAMQQPTVTGIIQYHH